ncbi:hypothetical protein L8106_25495 [Lyngbya sp. PCC 8106]|nr:hypothetical protein L8106_25495 [Lyngbya sp. PCC 8106]
MKEYILNHYEMYCQQYGFNNFCLQIDQDILSRTVEFLSKIIEFLFLIIGLGIIVIILYKITKTFAEVIFLIFFLVVSGCLYFWMFKIS